jgi:hypothetical protein
MVQISKQSVQQWMMFEYLTKKHRFQDTISLFERKYGVALETFEKHFETAEKEIHEEWDDYIDWKAAHEFLIRINAKIQDIKNGNIEVVD